MAFGLIFLFFLPIGIPLSLIIIPFLAGRSGAKELPKDWHSTFVITVGGSCSLGLVFALYVILSLSLGPALKIGITEPLILGVVAALIWGSFFIGVRNSTELKNEVQINEEEWDKEEQEETSKEKNNLIAFDNGYSKSKITILDANITTIIAAIILFIFGSGPVKGFSITLCVGILTTLFSVFFIARLLTSIYVKINKHKEIVIK